MRRTASAAVALGVLVAVPAAASARWESLYSGPGPRPGPNLLYERPAVAPQLTNSGVWRARPILVSGATAYRKGEFLYQDYLYDDHGARRQPDPTDPRTAGNLFSRPNGTYTYPTDPRYANNAADLVELRLKPLLRSTAFRVTLNTLKDPSLVAFTIAIGGRPGEEREFPHGANVRAPASLFLTVHPDGSRLVAELARAADGRTVPGRAPRVALDRGRRQIEVRVSHRQWNPRRRTVRLAAGVGLWDGATNRYLLPRPAADSSHPGGAGAASAPAAFYNVAYRTQEPLPSPTEGLNVVTSAAWWRDRAQGTALAAGDISRLFANVSFRKLALKAKRKRVRRRYRACGRRCSRRVRVRLPRVRGARVVRATVRYGGRVLRRARGHDLRHLRVRRPTRRRFVLRVRVRTNRVPQRADNGGVPRSGPMDRILASHFETAQGADFSRSCLTQAAACLGQYRGRLQPYAIYVPRKPRAASGWGMTLLLHSLSAPYNQYLGTRNQAQFGERGPGSIVITPEARGPDENYENYGASDVFEVWADVARRYRLDPAWSVITGYSMGGVGTFKLGSQFPDLFARAQPTVGFESEADVLASLRNVPVLMWNNVGDELVNQALYNGTAAKLDSLGYRYELDEYQPCANSNCSPVFANHIQLAINDQYAPAAAFLGTARVDRSPTHVTYVLEADRNHANLRLMGDHAYWIYGLRLRGGSEGQIDAISRGFGTGDPAAGGTRLGAGTLSGGNMRTIAFAQRSKRWGSAPRAAVRNQIDVTATNLAAASIDVRRAHVDCGVKVNVTSNGPIAIALPGCGRTVHAG
jgi:dienelactone hydrolase